VLLSVLNKSEKFTTKTVIGLTDKNTYVEGKINGDSDNNINNNDMKNLNITNNVTNNNSGN